jgi:hypothetical protein
VDPRDSEHVKAFDEALKVWVDSRFVTAEQIRDLAMFSLYLVNLAEADGWEYSGHSYRTGSPMGTLVVKAYRDDIPLVVFTSGRTYISCVRMFLRKLDAGLLEWRDDQYRR